MGNKLFVSGNIKALERPSSQPQAPHIKQASSTKLYRHFVARNSDKGESLYTGMYANYGVWKIFKMNENINLIRATSDQMNYTFIYEIMRLMSVSTVKSLIWDATNPETQMFLVSSYSCICPIYWMQVLSLERRRSWSNTDRRCSNYIWGINNLIANQSETYVRDLTARCVPRGGAIWAKQSKSKQSKAVVYQSNVNNWQPDKNLWNQFVCLLGTTRQQHGHYDTTRHQQWYIITERTISVYAMVISVQPGAACSIYKDVWLAKGPQKSGAIRSGWGC